MKKDKVLAIVGPTASGKTSWALQAARLFGGEIISADSRQVYREMDIGTGKEITSDVVHHLIDIVDPDEDYTLAHFLTDAKKAISDITFRGKLPIIVGGTGLYVQALVENWLVPEVAPDQHYRDSLEKKNLKELKAMLQEIDPTHAEQLGTGKRYIIRALEMHKATGKKPSELKAKQERQYDCLVVGVKMPREKLYARIDSRVDQMFADGLEQEVEALLQKYDPRLKAFKTIGYQEFIDRHDNPKERIKFASHAYARRQLTWLKRMAYIKWCDEFSDAKKEIVMWFDK